ncbi:palmitoyltransferase ZDHHC3-like [Acanthaster planci]|uniref:Palmitoyltransferase n=1 Tax=Acanthaster planci TaxID=133434 RepID=A0A8B7YI69_ACAPL|nr:palmitoyltransferase ZDHHC3-like [Acanthaster planci]
MVVFRNDPCGIVCLFITYFVVLYSDYVVIEWLIIPTMFDSIWGAFHGLVFNIIVFMIFLSHLRAVLSDPGIVPLPSINLDFSGMKAGQVPKKLVTKDGISWSICQKCEAYRPPRAHHCRICRRCIRKMDHHCPWINNCVGEFNQKYFIQFLFYVGVAGLYAIMVTVISWTYDCPICQNMIHKNARIAHSIILVVLSLLFGLFVIAIGCDQFQAIFEDETAVEHVKNKSGSVNGYRSTKDQKSKMMLLQEVFGKGSVFSWMLPWRSARRVPLTPPVDWDV